MATDPGYERFTDRALKVMQLANQEAHRFYHEYLGTEHILVVLTRDPTFEQLLLAQGVTGEQVRDAITAELRKYGR